MPKHFLFAITLFLSIFSGPMHAQETGEDSVKQNRNSFYPIPIIFWTPVTKLAGGISVAYVMRQGDGDSAARPSVAGATFIYSQKKQVLSSVALDRYWERNRYHFVGNAGYMKFPTVFYGIGSRTLDSNGENYTPKTTSVFVNVHKKIRNGLYVGLQYEWNYTRIVKVKTNGNLDTNRITGENFGAASGLGAVAYWDTRENIVYPRSGSYHQFSVVPFAAIFGSRYKFVRATLDLRKYFTLFGTHVFGYQIYANVITGDPPFYKMSLFGGSNLMRGYFEGRYRDRDMLAFQVEYRLPVWWRFGLAGFAGYGDVAHTLDAFRIHNFKYSVGWGIRFCIDKSSNANIRVDIAFGKNSAYPAIGIGEAF